MKKIFKILLSVMMAVTLSIVCIGSAKLTAYADYGDGITSIMPDELSEGEFTEETENGLQDDISPDNNAVNAFISFLKEKYGEEYEAYYNKIINTYGSISAYIDNKLDGNASDTVLTAWGKVKAWLNEYKAIWGGCLAVIAVIVVLLFGRHWISSAVLAIRSFFRQIMNGYKLMIKASGIALESQKILLGNNPKYEEQRKKIEEISDQIEKEIGND